MQHALAVDDLVVAEAHVGKNLVTTMLEGTGFQVVDLGINIPVGNDSATSRKLALDGLFAHANVPSFVSKQLIQHMVTSNPSPAYVSRVANVFANNGSGVRGDGSAELEAGERGKGGLAFVLLLVAIAGGRSAGQDTLRVAIKSKDAHDDQFVHTVAFSPDGNTLMATSYAGIAHLWRAPSWAEIEAAEKGAVKP